MFRRTTYASTLCLLLASCSLSPVGSVTVDESGVDAGTGGDGTGGSGGGGGVTADAGATGGNADGGFSGVVDGEPSELAGITNAHNNVRAAHGVGPMTWDNDLAAVAQTWANNCVWGHNDGRSDNYPGYVGENLYGASFVPSGQAVTDSWASEEQFYDYESNTCSGVCGHDTQVVWANSVKLGCAIANCPNIPTSNIVVCNYSPGGNFNGQRPY